MNSVIGDLNIAPIVYSVNYGLRILMMKHVFPKENLSGKIKMNILFKTKDVRKIRI